ncbi:MAG: hypothetical protein ACYCSG_01990 [Thermoplasmataceae archaeon]
MTKCARCSFENENNLRYCKECRMPLIQPEQYSSFKSDMSLFPIFSIISAIILIVGNIYLESGLSASFSNLSNLTISQVNTLKAHFSYLISIYLTLISLSIAIYAFGVYKLRKGYKILAGRNRRFNPPMAGGTLALMGLISLIPALLMIAAVSGSLFSSFFANTNGSTYHFAISSMDYDILFLAGGIAVFALFLLFLGTIPYLYIGMIRLAREFQNYYFFIAFLLFLADIVISATLGSLSYAIFPSGAVITPGGASNSSNSLYSFSLTGFNTSDLLISIVALAVFIAPNMAILMALRKEKLLSLNISRD